MVTRSTRLLQWASVGIVAGALISLLSIALDSPTGLSCLGSVGCGWHISFYVTATLITGIAARRLPPAEAVMGLAALAVTQLLIGFVWAPHGGDGDGLAVFWVLVGIIPSLVVTFCIALVRWYGGAITRRKT